MVIAGPPNAGKSTLLNRIARREAAIVSPIAGTTRDVIEVHLDLNGYPVNLIDTAGIRESSDDPVEREGMRRAREQAARADLVLWVVEAAEADAPLAPTHRSPGGPRIGPWSTRWTWSSRGAAAAGVAVQAPWSDVHSISATTGAGLDELIDALVAIRGANVHARAGAGDPRASARGADRGCASLADAEKLAEQGAGEELIAEQLRARGLRPRPTDRPGRRRRHARGDLPRLLRREVMSKHFPEIRPNGRIGCQ